MGDFTMKIPIPHFNTDPFYQVFLTFGLKKKKKKNITMLCDRNEEHWAAKKAAVAFLPKLPS